MKQVYIHHQFRYLKNSSLIMIGIFKDFNSKLLVTKLCLLFFKFQMS